MGFYSSRGAHWVDRQADAARRERDSERKVGLAFETTQEKGPTADDVHTVLQRAYLVGGATEPTGRREQTRGNIQRNEARWSRADARNKTGFSQDGRMDAAGDRRVPSNI